MGTGSQQINIHFINIYGYFSKALGGVGVKINPGFPANFPNV
jgi:hypothetical protein